jgi:hypothetical protein
MRFASLAFLGISTLYGQTCAPVAILPVAQVSGQLDGSSCSLSDSSPYAAYRLVFPVRGNLQASVSAGAATLGMILRDGTGAQISSGATIAQAVESGSYTLLVNAATPAAIAAGAVPYTLQTAFTAEPGMLCTNFPMLGLNQTVAGTLGASGCVFPDGTPYEAYTLSALGSGVLTVSVASSAFTPTVTVRGGDGTVLGSGAGTISVPLAASTNYRVIVGSADTAGAYQISTAFQASNSETCVPQKMLTQAPLTQAPLAQPDSDSGAVTASSCWAVEDSEGDLAYYNYYGLTVSSAGLADLAASSGDFTPTLYLLDAAGNQVAADTGGGSNGSAEMRLQLSPGSYLVEVYSNLASGGNYTLTYSFTPGAPVPCLPATLNPGDAPAGTLSTLSCRTELGLTDLYTLTLPTAGTLSLNLAATTFTGQIVIRDTKDTLIALNQDLEGLGDSNIAAVLPAGTYTIAAAAIEGSGAYQLTTTIAANPLPPCPTAQPLATNGGYIQTLGARACVGSNGQAVDLYQFTLPSDGVVAAVMTSGDFAGDLTLTGSSGNVLRHDRDSYAPNDPLIVQFLTAGTYQLAARASASGSGGLYQVTLITTLGPRPPFCGALASLPLGSGVTANLGTTSCQYVDGTFADIYPVTLAGDTSVDLRLNSNDFDAYLVLLDAKGNLLVQDDDSGGGTNSRIVQQLSAGTYYVVAKPFANYYNIGSYTLSLAQYQAPSQGQ